MPPHFSGGRMDLSLSNVHPMLAMPTHRDIPADTVRALLTTLGEMQRRNIPLTLNLSDGGSLVHHARTRCGNEFLKSDCTHLFFIDSDMDWKPDDFLRFVALGTKMECVAATYPRKQDKTEFFIDYIDKTITPNEYGCIAIKGCGLGFTIIARTIMEQLALKAPKLRYSHAGLPQPRLFRCDEYKGASRGEDHAFFADVRELGHKVHLDPTVTLGHIGQKNYKASVFEAIARTAA